VPRRVTAPSCFSRGRVNDGAGAINTISFRPRHETPRFLKESQTVSARNATRGARAHADNARLGVSSFHGFEMDFYGFEKGTRYVHTPRIAPATFFRRLLSLGFMIPK